MTPANVVVWHATGVANPIDADRLSNGNTLIVCQAQKNIFELDAKGKTVREFHLAQRVYDSHRLPNGDTLIGGQGFLHRYDGKGKKIWSVDVKFAMSIEHY